MAHYDVKHICGHTSTVQLFGPTKERERKLEWIAGQLCGECAEEEARKHASENGLPFKVRPNVSVFMNGITITATIEGNTYNYRSVIKDAGYTWNGYEWTKQIARLNWGETLNEGLVKCVDGMQWSASLFKAFIYSLNSVSETNVVDAIRANKDLVKTTGESLRQQKGQTND